MSDSKFKGNVKWFSNRKGFGFITPSSDNSPTTEDIFVHHSNIVSDGTYRTLTDGYEVEFEVTTEESGKLKCQNVTAPGGGPCSPPPPPSGERRRRRRRGKGGGKDGEGSEDDVGNTEDEAENDGEDDGANGKKDADGKESDKKEDKQQPKKKGKGGGDGGRGGRGGGGGGNVGGPNRRKGPWHDGNLADNVKEMVKEKKMSLDKTTIDVASGDSRIKLSAGGYVGFAHASGTLAEGLYTCDDQGVVKFEWKRVLMFSDGEWKASDVSNSNLLQSFEWKDESLGAVKEGETPKMLWGDKNDPSRDLLEKNEFQMRRVILERSAASAGPRNRRRGGGGRGRGGRGGGGRGDGGDASGDASGASGDASGDASGAGGDASGAGGDTSGAGGGDSGESKGDGEKNES